MHRYRTLLLAFPVTSAVHTNPARFENGPRQQPLASVDARVAAIETWCVRGPLHITITMAYADIDLDLGDLSTSEDEAPKASDGGDDGGDERKSSSAGAAGATAEVVTIENAFDKYDADDSGAIDAGELGALCDELDAPLTETELEEALAALDSDGSGRIEKSEFVSWWTGRSGGGGKLGKKLAKLAEAGKKRNYTDVHVAAWSGNVEVLQQFLDLDAALRSARDATEHGDDNTPLHYAAYNGHVAACEQLLGVGADVNAKNGSGCTPVFFAAQQGHDSVLKLLLEQSPTLAISETTYGMTALDVAATPSIKAMLIAAGEFETPPIPDPPTVRVLKSGMARAEWEMPVDPSDDTVLPPTGYRMIVTRIRSAEDDAAGAGADDGEAKESTQIGELTCPANTLSAHVQGLTIGSTYVFTVSAVNAVGESPMSARSAPLKFARVPARPSPPSVEEPRLKDLVCVSWTHPDARGSEINGYQLVRRNPDDPDEEPVLIDTFPGTTTSVKLGPDDLPKGRDVAFEVVLFALNALGQSAPSAAVRVDPVKPTNAERFGLPPAKGKKRRGKRRASASAAEGGTGGGDDGSAESKTGERPASAKPKVKGTKGGSKRGSSKKGGKGKARGESKADAAADGGDGGTAARPKMAGDELGAWDADAGATSAATPIDAPTPGIEEAAVDAAEEFAVNQLSESNRQKLLAEAGAAAEAGSATESGGSGQEW